MNKITSAAVVMVTVLLMSCGGNDTPEIDKSIMPAADSNKIAPATTNAVPAVSPQSGGVQGAPQVVTAVPNAETQQGAKTISAADAAKAMPAAGLNPAHGQPGHRCDIAVGAPLNSAPTVATQPQPVQAAPAVQPVTVAAPSSSSAPADPNAKLNPAHGQPGHDCAIPVGAPLKKG